MMMSAVQKWKKKKEKKKKAHYLSYQYSYDIQSTFLFTILYLLRAVMTTRDYYDEYCNYCTRYK